MVTFVLAGIVITAAGACDFFPAERLNRPYHADPHAPTFSSRRVFTDEGGNHIGNGVGGVFPLIEFRPTQESDHRFQFTASAGVWNRFDLDENWDMIAEDWRFGFGLLYGVGGWVFGTHIQHESDHLGDELVIRTGATRTAYRRDEWGWSIERTSWRALRIYGLAGYGVILGHQNEPWRFQAGIELEEPDPLFLSAHPYVALDIQTRQEVDWDRDLGIQIGLAFRKKGTRYTFRLATEAFRGHQPFGELFRQETEYLGAGFYLDL